MPVSIIDRQPSGGSRGSPPSFAQAIVRPPWGAPRQAGARSQIQDFLPLAFSLSFCLCHFVFFSTPLGRGLPVSIIDRQPSGGSRGSPPLLRKQLCDPLGEHPGKRQRAGSSASASILGFCFLPLAFLLFLYPLGGRVAVSIINRQPSGGSRGSPPYLRKQLCDPFREHPGKR